MKVCDNAELGHSEEKHSIIDQGESQIGTFHQMPMGESKWNQRRARSGGFHPRSRRERRGKPEAEHSIVDQGRESQKGTFYDKPRQEPETFHRGPRQGGFTLCVGKLQCPDHMDNARLREGFPQTS